MRIDYCKVWLTVALLILAGQAAAQVTFYERENFQGRSFTTDQPVGNFEQLNFNNRASSVVVVGQPWEVCESANFGGRCVVLRAGQYPSLESLGMNDRISSVRTVAQDVRPLDNRAPVPRAAAPAPVPAPVVSRVTFYEKEGFDGRSFTAGASVGDLGVQGFDNRASAVVVEGDSWELCEGTGFSGRCVALQPGRYPTLAALGLDNRVSSVRAVPREVRVEAPRPVPLVAPSSVVLYERDAFEGRSLTADKEIDDLGRHGFNDRASSIVVVGDSWEACEDARFSGRCVVLRPGRYPSLGELGLGNRVSSVRAISRDARAADNRPSPATGLPAAQGAAQIIFYGREDFDGRSFALDRASGDLEREGFNNRASSAVVLGERWEACSEAEFRGRCVVLRPGRYPSLASMGLDNSVSSVRVVRRDAQIDNQRYAPMPLAVYDNRRRNDERLYQVTITTARAVMGPPEQRCWVEREQVVHKRNDANVGGAIVGALIGGILGHQVGGGTGKDIATAGGAVAGAVVGSRMGNDSRSSTTGQDVQRCSTTTTQAPPAYWDVTYTFRGQEHRVQMATQPGPTITVNEQGEPRA